MTTQEKSIHRQLTIDEIFSSFPHKSQRLAHEMTQAGLHCVGCNASTQETLEAGMMSHGFTDEAIDAMITRLNAILEEEFDLDTIVITERAARKFLAILEEDGKQGWGLRLDEKPAGCNGYEYVLDFSEKAGPDDATFESRGIEIHVSRAQISRLLGSEVDYVESLMGAGFKVSNPNVRSSCGCGSSHGY